MTDVRRVLLVVHTGRSEAINIARESAKRLTDEGIAVRVLAEDASDLAMDRVEVASADDEQVAAGCEIVMVLGGDGTILRGADVARNSGVPLLGVNLGHIGFLAESERDEIDVTIDHVVNHKYAVEERMTIDIQVTIDGRRIEQWALNEASVEKSARERMLEVVVEVDGRPLSRWGADGVVAATPTGSTAYAFSAGGPIVWPTVEALLVVPLSAHALFARPMVVAPDSVIAVELLPRNPGPGVLWCDGRRTEDLPPGARVEVRRGVQPVRLARLHHAPFTDRLVAKFGLPVEGWRGRRSYES
jgi:NAD+ kinase